MSGLQLIIAGFGHYLAAVVALGQYLEVGHKWPVAALEQHLEAGRKEPVAALAPCLEEQIAPWYQ